MKVLALDPGAKRMGFALLEGNGYDPPQYWHSGIVGLEQGSMSYHNYRLDLIGYIENWITMKLHSTAPAVVVSELLPVKGFRDMSQAFLAMTAISTVQAIASRERVVVAQVAVPTIKCKIAGQARATKVQVRNGVVKLLPQLQHKAKGSWTKEFDEPDAIAVGLTYLGYDNST